MKVWIDKQGGTHYHKADCKMILPIKNGRLPQIAFHYEEIEHRIRHFRCSKEYADIIVDGNRYWACPICFGHKREKK